MNLTEGMGKALLDSAGIPVAVHYSVGPGEYDEQTATKIASEFARQGRSGEPRDMVVKALTYSGSKRAGKGGVIVGPRDWQAMNRHLVAFTGENAQIGDEESGVNLVFGAYVEERLHLARELYVSIAYNRSGESPELTLTVSAHGGEHGIEEVQRTTPERVHRMPLDVLEDLDKDDGAFADDVLGFLEHALATSPVDEEKIDSEYLGEIADGVKGMYRLVIDRGAELVEINPLVITEEGKVYAGDAKIRIDANADPVTKREVSDLVGFPYEMMMRVRRGQPEPQYIELIDDVGRPHSPARLDALRAHFRDTYGDAGRAFVELPGGNVVLFGFGAGIKDMVAALDVLGLHPLVMTEASGNPGDRKCYQWAEAVFSVLEQGEVIDGIVIYGGRAMMTDAVNTLYKGVFKAWREHPSYDPDIPVVMRREAINQEEANRLIAENYVRQGMNVTMFGTEKNPFETCYHLVAEMDEFMRAHRDREYVRRRLDERRQRLRGQDEQLRANPPEEGIRGLADFTRRFGGFELDEQDMGYLEDPA